VPLLRREGNQEEMGFLHPIAQGGEDGGRPRGLRRIEKKEVHGVPAGPSEKKGKRGGKRERSFSGPTRKNRAVDILILGRA